MVALLYQGIALLMDQTGVDTVLVEEVILKPGMFPSSQISLIMHEKLILVFCPYTTQSQQTFRRASFSLKSTRSSIQRNMPMHFNHVNLVFLYCTRTYRCQMFRANKTAFHMFTYKELSHGHLHPKDRQMANILHACTQEGQCYPLAI